jgi:hypothetical protein
VLSHLTWFTNGKPKEG